MMRKQTYKKDFETIAIVGSGQIGTSIAMDVANRFPDRRVFLYDVRDGFEEDVRTAFKNAKISTARVVFCTSPERLLDAELVVLAAPVDQFAAAVRKVGKCIDPGAIVIDVGSVKEAPAKDIREALDLCRRYGVEHVSCHPMNGNAGSGALSARTDLFDGKPVIMVPEKEKLFGVISRLNETEQKVAEFWRSMGGGVQLMSAKKHDEIVATTSHLEHLLAFSLMNSPFVKKYLDEQEALDVNKRALPGPWFEGMTRIADANPGMWLPILMANKKNVISAVMNFRDVSMKVELLLSCCIKQNKGHLPDRTRESTHHVREFLSGTREYAKRLILKSGYSQGDSSARNEGKDFADIALFLSAAISQNAKNLEKKTGHALAPIANRSFKDGLYPIASSGEPCHLNVIGSAPLRTRIEEFSGELKELLSLITEDKWDAVGAKIETAAQNRTRLMALKDNVCAAVPSAAAGALVKGATRDGPGLF